jgi:hypothetical protein
VRQALANGLYYLCWLFDVIPGRWDGKWHRYGDWGCYPLRISRLALKIEEGGKHVQGEIPSE